MSLTSPSLIVARLRAARPSIFTAFGLRNSRRILVDWIVEQSEERDEWIDALIARRALVADGERAGIDFALRLLCHTPDGDSLFRDGEAEPRRWVR
jgi:hypothetical protein